jgi:hypothetical protein
MPTRTYDLDEDTIDWIDEFAEENDARKKDVVNRAIKVYAYKVAKGEWSDPKFEDKLDRNFDKIT